MNEPIPKDLVKPKYHREGWLRNLDEYKADAVLTPEAQQRAGKLLGRGWKSMKPSAVLRSLGKGKKAYSYDRTAFTR